MSKVLIIGAGREGKGFLGETFSADGWDVSFLDKDPKVISNLQNGAYDVKLYEPEGVRTHTVTGYHAYLADENYCCMEDALEASIPATLGQAESRSILFRLRWLRSRIPARFGV